MHSHWPADVYTAREIARAAGVPLESVVAAVGHPDALVRHDDAVRLGRALRKRVVVSTPLFANHRGGSSQRPLFFAVSSTLHAMMFAGILFLTTVTVGPIATALHDEPREETQLVFLATPGPGGGGGGGRKARRGERGWFPPHPWVGGGGRQGATPPGKPACEK